MPDRRTFDVSVEDADRLDRFLADQLSISRTQAARLVAEGAVEVNGKVARASLRPARGDRIAVTLTAPEAPRAIQPHPIDLAVVFEDEHLMVIDKPPGLVVHPAPGHWQDTLVNALAARGTARPEGGAPERRGIVHRLDRDTSGLMIVAKTDRAHRILARSLERRRIRRVYAALAWGHLKTPTETIDAPLARSPRDRKRMMVVATGRAARTTAEQVARFALCDLLRVTLETGRTHQIRVHLAHIGHPVVGDLTYGGGGARRVTGGLRPEAERLERAVPRQALHAALLEFTHPATGEKVAFRSPWPDDLREALDRAMGAPDSVARQSGLDYLGFFQRDG